MSVYLRSFQFFALFVLLIVAAILHLKLGARQLDWSVVWQALVAYVPADPLHNIVMEMRMPRLISAVIVGATLGLAGALMQAVSENPLADPGLMGVNSGAAFFVVFGLLVLPGNTLAMIPLLAFAGAIVAAAIVLLNSGSDPNPVRLVLSGVMVAALFSALTSMVLLLDQQGLETLRRWLVGSLAFDSSVTRWQTFPFILLAGCIAVANIPALNLHRLGSQSAALMGLNVLRMRLSSLLAIVLLAGSSVAIAGPIGFVGLIAPHIGRIFLGNDYRFLVPAAPLIGALLIVTGDIVSRTALRPLEINTGIVTAIVGGPIFIALVLGRVK
ncbi:FecCD family ABC transporter permease [Ochrobactrum sp. S1502_03]|uniref:FecCD family ABC transporter permease n=1 Tax=Ochrobactrum sp. S1502_03 TaxID=3108451 RepID=UPI0037CAA53B